MSWWEDPYWGKSGMPAVITFVGHADHWRVWYAGHVIAITTQSIFDGLDPAATINAFIAATDRGEPFNGISRESNSASSGDPAQPQSGAGAGNPCRKCGHAQSYSTDLCRQCFNAVYGQAGWGQAAGGLNSRAMISPITPGAAGVNSSALLQSIRDYQQRKSDDLTTAAIYALQAMPTAQSTLAAQRQKSADMRNLLLFGSSLPPAAYVGIPASKAWIDAPDMPVPCSGFVTGEIIAWRAWQVRAGYLKSLSQDAVWPPGSPMEGKVGSAEHGEGVYAFKDRNKLFHFMGGDAPTPVVWGSVALWGDVVEHELGYRAQFCEVRSIEGAYPAQAAEKHLIGALRECYGLRNDR